MNFSCQESCGGKCCTLSWREESPFVFLTRGDQYRLAQYLDRPLEFFSERAVFTSTRFSDKPTMQYFLKKDGNKCKFFLEGKCGVYPARPTQCRTFPYWPENIVKGDFKDDIAASCPGIGRGTDSWAKGSLAAQREVDRELSENVIR